MKIIEVIAPRDYIKRAVIVAIVKGQIIAPRDYIKSVESIGKQHGATDQCG